MLRPMIIATLLVAGAVLSEPVRSAEAQPQGVALTGQDDTQTEVTADLHGYIIAVQKKESECSLPWYVHTGTSTAPVLGMNEPLISCTIYFCTSSKLKNACKKQPDWFSVGCTGTWSAEPDGRFKLDVNYLYEYWSAPECRLKKTKEKKSVVFLLKRPPKADGPTSTLPSMSDLTKCAVHAYLPGSHPLHGEGCN